MVISAGHTSTLRRRRSRSLNAEPSRSAAGGEDGNYSEVEVEQETPSSVYLLLLI